MRRAVGRLRRRELLALLAALGASALSSPRSLASAAGADPEPPARDLAARFANAASAALIGAVYLRDHPEERDPDRLREGLGFAAGRPTEALAARHRDDFRRGAVVRLGGFTFSRTELRLCALLHLLDG